MLSSMCGRCPAWAGCCLDPGGKACKKHAKECGFNAVPTNFDRIKDMDIEEMAEFLKSMVDENGTHEVACYGCINYGTHHSDPKNKGTHLYECEDCYCEGIGLDLVAWLNKECDAE